MLSGRARRRKGAEAERELVAHVRRHDPDAPGRRLGASRDGGEDLRYAGVRIECKRHRKVQLTAWYRQALEQADGQPAAVAFREDRQEWVIMPIMSVGEFVQWARSRKRST